MLFRRLDATFGTLSRRSLSFAPGLNVIEASNEAGKSTLAAFLRTMLYGFAPRDRDKSRYLPWSGAPMQGTLELSTETFGDVTLRRDTARANSPMGHFSATHTGTGDEVAGLSGADCGEVLLGVPREVYERSAFIRQSGLAVEPDAELERRIAALITTGEEGVSYSEADAALKKQLNARRANSRSGLIPALEQEIEACRRESDELRGLLDERGEAEAELASLREEEASLRKQVTAHELADRQQQFSAREQAKRDADDAAREARMFRKLLSDSHVPTREVLEENRSRLRTVEDLERQLRETGRKRGDAELALSQFDAAPRPSPMRPVAVLWLILLLLSAAVVPAALLFPLTVPLTALYGSAVAVVLFASLLTLERQRAQRLRRERAAERERLAAALSEAEAVCTALKSTKEQTLTLIYADIPAGDAVGASSYVHENLARYDLLAQMEAEARDKRRHYEEQPHPDLKGVPASPVERPARSREELERALEDNTRRRAEMQSRFDYTSGRLRALCDAGELEAALAEKEARLAEALAEYDAIALARETLERANAALQSRFSPELGKRAAEYFSSLTDGKYDAVALDRAFRALATESGESVSRSASLLSQGANDQLYLAVRLAICDMVLPAEKHVPLVLDDAFVSFDDARCAAALKLLLRESETRQILLLTCQHREAAYLTNLPNVTILSL